MPKRPAKLWQVLVPCDCGRKAKTALFPGPNDIRAVCDCGAVWRVSVDVDSEGNAKIYQGNIIQE